MTFKLDTVTVAGRQFATINHNDFGANKITLITGANGTGKTRLLSGLAAQFSGRSHLPSDVLGTTGNGSLAEPSRVVAQTFSPFSRFPSERARALSLEEYLKPPSQKYVAIGFTRSVGLRGSVSKDAVSRIVRKLYTQPEQATPLANALWSLGFEPRLRITYSRSPVGRNLDLKERDATKLHDAVDEFLSELAAKSKRSGEEIRISREIASQPRVELTNQLINAIRAIQPSLPNKFNKHQSRELTIDLPLMEEGRIPRDELEGAIILARLGLLRVSDCFLGTIPLGRWRWETQNSIVTNELSIVDASSGEQQLLSSLFGLVAEMQDDALVLIDEPELSLHPSWQTQFLDLLHSVIQPFKGCHVLVATHSPLLAQRGQELGIPVLSLDENRQTSYASNPTASIEQTLIDVFELPIRDSTYVGRLLLSLVMAAEQGTDSAALSRLRIEKLKELYERATIPDQNTLALIDDALALVELGSQDQGDAKDQT